MAPKQRNTRDATPSTTATPQAGPSIAAAAPPQPRVVSTKPSSTQAQNWDQVLANIYDHYLKTTPQRTKLIDSFMAFLVVVGALQFLYCVLAGNYVSLDACQDGSESPSR